MSDRTERIRVSTVGYIGQGQRRRGLHGNPLWIAIKRQFSGLLIKVSVAHKSKAAVKDQFIIYWRTTAKWFGTHHSEWGRRFAMMLKGRRRWLFVSLKLLSSCVMGMKINIRILKLGIAGHNTYIAGRRSRAKQQKDVRGAIWSAQQLVIYHELQQPQEKLLSLN